MFLISAILLYSIICLDLKFVDDDQALCLDGSLGSYYYSKGYGNGKNNFIIHFEGGEWILGNTENEFLQSAIDRYSIRIKKMFFRQSSIYGSSINRPSSQVFDGLLSTNSTLNPHFYNWNLIQINYCDGTGYYHFIYQAGFQGKRLDPMLFNTKWLYFRGELIVKSIFHKFGQLFQEANILIISGCSIGAVASLLWTEQLVQITPARVSIYCISDSGILIDMISISVTELLKTSIQIMNYIVDKETIIPNQKCALNYPNQTWKCFYLSNLLNFISQPVFIIQSLYDTNFLSDYLQINCVNDLTLNNCSPSELQHINIAHNNFQNIIKSRISDSSTTGSFAPSCLSNCLILNSLSYSKDWKIPEKSGQTIQEALIKWIDGQQRKNSNSERIALIDDVIWPNNAPCSQLVSYVNILKLINLMYYVYVLLNF